MGHTASVGDALVEVALASQKLLPKLGDAGLLKCYCSVDSSFTLLHGWLALQRVQGAEGLCIPSLSVCERNACILLHKLICVTRIKNTARLAQERLTSVQKTR